jgi:hypothetical protein
LPLHWRQASGKDRPFGNIESARQAIIDHAGLIDLPPRGLTITFH